MTIIITPLKAQTLLSKTIHLPVAKAFLGLKNLVSLITSSKQK